MAVKDIGVPMIMALCVLGGIVLLTSQKANSSNNEPIKSQGRTAQTLGIPVNANPELDPAARRIWLDGYMDARREHLRKMGMLRSDHGDGTAEIIEDID